MEHSTSNGGQNGHRARVDRGGRRLGKCGKGDRQQRGRENRFTHVWGTVRAAGCFVGRRRGTFLRMRSVSPS